MHGLANFKNTHSSFASTLTLKVSHSLVQHFSRVFVCDCLWCALAKLEKYRKICPMFPQMVSWDSSVGLATGRTVRGSNPCGVQILRTCPDRPWSPLNLVQEYSGYWVSPGGKTAGGWRWQLTPSSAQVQERVQLYLYSPFGPSLHFLWWTLHFYLFLCSPNTRESAHSPENAETLPDFFLVTFIIRTNGCSIQTNTSIAALV
jgi:hypothetical protein